MAILKDAVEHAYEQNVQLFELSKQQGLSLDYSNEETMKIFIAPEFCTSPVLNLALLKP